jgi:hypothetical protein
MKEHFFSRKEELDFRSKYFDPVKWWQFISVILLFVIMLFTGSKLFTITIKYARLKVAHQEMVKELEKKNHELLETKVKLKIEGEQLDHYRRYCYFDTPDGEPPVSSKAKPKKAVIKNGLPLRQIPPFERK